jgi:hypothetical protein
MSVTGEFDVLEKAKAVYFRAMDQSEAVNPDAIRIALEALRFIQDELTRRVSDAR